MASIERTKSGKWSCRIYVGKKDGKNVYKRITADTRKEAERQAHIYLEEHPISRSGSDMTVKEAMEAYVEAKNEILSPSTIAGYKRIIAHRFVEIQNQPIAMITREELQAAVNKEAACRSPKSVSNAVCLLSAAFSMFKLDISGLTLPQKKKTEIVIPTDDELEKLTAASEKWGISLPVHLAAYMGMRRSEIAALDLEKDVNLDAKTLRINKAVVAGEKNVYITKGTKTTNSTRVLPIPSVVLPVIQKAIEEKQSSLTPGAIEGRFIKMKRAIGLNHITLHSLRHYFASTLVVMDVPDFYAMKLMGHSSDRMLKNVYQHVRQEYMDEITEKMDTFFSAKNKNMTTT
jgi:integrase